MISVEKNLNSIRKRINLSAKKAERDPKDIKLIAVSKTKSSNLIRDAYNAGQKFFGENYVQELRQKAEELSDLEIEWHFIGNLQRNKVKYIVPIVRYIHSINSVKLAEEIQKRAKTPIKCMIEINLGAEETKTGSSYDDGLKIVASIRDMNKLDLVGLMTMPPYDDNPEKSRPYFIHLRETLNEINNKNLYTKELTELSMGMTGDLEVAIEEGATFIRVGTATFGER